MPDTLTPMEPATGAATQAYASLRATSVRNPLRRIWAEILGLRHSAQSQILFFLGLWLAAVLAAAAGAWTFYVDQTGDMEVARAWRAIDRARGRPDYLSARHLKALETLHRLSRDGVPSARLRGIILTREYRRGGTSRVTGTNLTGVRLPGADLSGADLRFAILRGANLRAADLSRALLAGADLAGADLHGADLSAADLSDATGLSPDQLAAACHRIADGRTLAPLLPAGLAPPPVCASERAVAARPP